MPRASFDRLIRCCLACLAFLICYWLLTAAISSHSPRAAAPSATQQNPTPLTPTPLTPASQTRNKSNGSSDIRDFHWHYQQLQRQVQSQLYRFDWKLLMPLMRLEPNETKRESRVRAGLAWMRTQGLVVAATVRDAIRGVPDSVKHSNRLRALFNRSWIVLVETDSTDGTRAYLHNLTRRDPTIRLLGCGGLNSREPCRPGVKYRSGRVHQPGWAMPRSREEKIDRGLLMAALRNQYLTYTYDHLVPLGATLLMVIDADMTWFPWDLDSIAQGLYYFMAKPPLQQLCSHTCYANRKHLQDPCTLTFFNNKHFTEDLTREPLTYDNSLRNAAADLPPVKVSSCFQSIAFHRLADMAAGRVLYGGAPDEWTCEHNTLSRRLSEVYFDPQMKLDIDMAYVG